MFVTHITNRFECYIKYLYKLSYLDLEDKLDQLTSELSSERDRREAAENTREEVQLELSRERAEIQASVEHLQEQFQNEREHLQEQFQNEREHLQDVVREKDGELHPSLSIRNFLNDEIVL